ncbi:Haloacid dehalogenase-like hydrolase [Tribonema minus]|uniref:Haloacid dehalogenase-like hydrolase n=1 Tax=Tribonema minus TaxID=303371 RepID=A0A835ZES5_9STRA|nr:Haloacid dehalogenase-like hydrolase [Tribonema minus]
MCVNGTTSSIAVLFDFDGTVGDTETPAMEVAFWEAAPYLPNIAPSDLITQLPEYIRNNAGKAFEFMMEATDEDRKKAGLDTAEEMRQAKREDPAAVEVIDGYRKKFGLPPLRECKYATLLEQQKLETVEALSKVAQPCPGIPETLDELVKMGIPFCISTTSPKPRVPVSISSCGLDHHFPADKVHSGESDFTPPKFKPAPDVYLKAAKSEGKPPHDCVAVEDSGSGVGSAANAGVGMIVGYVGASHIREDKKDSHAKMLMSGDRSKDGRGADIVISNMRDLPKVIAFFKDQRGAGKSAPFTFPEDLLASLEKPIWKAGEQLPN